jgi:HD-GYP domain-containing protein (c-di-GMP phosphodiesterase class II)
MIISVISLLAGGLGLLWLSLYGMVRGASVTIERQNIGLQRLSDNLSYSLDQLLKNYMGTMESLAGAVEARDPYTGGHSRRVEGLSTAMSRQLKLSEDQALRLERAGELHDIGKIGIPETILTKPATLNPDEWGVMKEHPVLGAELIERVPFLVDVAPIVRHHHEHFDGSGYPDGLAGSAIPMEARILAIIDAFDAMISSRPYRDALEPSEAVRRLKRGSGTQFDPIVVEAFIVLYDRRQDLFKDLEAA